MSEPRSLTGESTANAAKTHTITMPSNRTFIDIYTLTVSTRGADIAADTTVAVADNGTTIWSVEMRSGKVFGGHFDFSGCPLRIKGGNCTIVVDAAGASVITQVSATYRII